MHHFVYFAPVRLKKKLYMNYNTEGFLYDVVYN